MSSATRAVAVLTLLLLVPVAAAAQSYSFAVPEMKMQVWVQPDASAKIAYEIRFRNNPGAHPIDVVDIGTPHEGYRIAGMSAAIDGHRLTDIRPSSYIDTGVEVHLGGRSIAAGGEGVFSIDFEMPNMVYQDTTRADYASLRITPTWFDPSVVTGGGTVQLAIHVPEGVEPDEVLHQGRAFQHKVLYAGRAVAVWEWPAPLDGARIVGVSFPKRGLERVVEMSRRELFDRWLRGHPLLLVSLPLLSCILLSVVYFRFTGGTGCIIYMLLLALTLAPVAAGSLWLYLLLIPVLGVLVAVNEGHLKGRKRRYLPAIAEVEGGGIKRGLIAPEAAVLLELPVGKVLGLVIFGLLKKGILRRVEAEDLEVEVIEVFAATGDGRGKARRRAAAEHGTVLHKWEGRFLDALLANRKQAVADIDFSKALEGLIEHAVGRMAGFDLEETRSYYRHVIRRALWQARKIGDIEQRHSFIDKNLEWILLGDGSDEVFDGGGHPYRPHWYWPRLPGSAGGSLPVPRPAGDATPSLGDVTGSFAGWAENTMGRLANAISPGSLSLADGGGGFIDLSGVDAVTADVFKAIAKTGGSGGGGGCACAGCACACACAGGGR